ncbi:hypothetical protein [Streptomyces sp. NPDC003032]
MLLMLATCSLTESAVNTRSRSGPGSDPISAFRLIEVSGTSALAVAAMTATS